MDNSRGCRVCTALTRRLKKAGPFDSRRWDDGPRSLGGGGVLDGGMKVVGSLDGPRFFDVQILDKRKDSFLPEIKQQKVP